jgi:hypothetical protein
MVTVIEHPPGSNEQYEFCEANSPDERPGWTVHAIIQRQRTETVSVMKSCVLAGATYPSSVTDQESHVVAYTVYLLRRRVSDALEQAAQKVERREREVVEQSKRILELETKISMMATQHREALWSYSEQSRIASIRSEELVRRCEKAGAMESDLAKLRDHLGKERFNLIIAEQKT